MYVTFIEFLQSSRNIDYETLLQLHLTVTGAVEAMNEAMDTNGN
jgi:hypothetical protein